MVLKVFTEDGNLKLQWDDLGLHGMICSKVRNSRPSLTRAKGFLTSEQKEQERAKPQALRRLNRDNSARDKVFHSRISLVRQPVLRKVSRHLHAPRI